MDNQHQKIKGYRDLTQEEIDLMNRVKEKGDELGALCKELSENIHAAYREKYQAAMDSTTKDAYGAPIHTDTDECDEIASDLIMLILSVGYQLVKPNCKRYYVFNTCNSAANHVLINAGLKTRLFFIIILFFWRDKNGNCICRLAPSFWFNA